MKVDQDIFRKALLAPDAPRPEGLSDGQGRPAGRRFDVYRNNVAVSLTEALETAFPVIRKLLGDQNFKLMAGSYFRKHPPGTPVMMFYGHEMSEFLAGFPPTDHLRYLPDVARMELAMRESYHEADAEPIDPSSLQSLSPDALSAATFCLAPATRLVRSRWPIHSIRRYNVESDAPKPTMAAEDVLIARPDMDPVPLLLPAGGGEFVVALIDGKSLEEAADQAAQSDEAFDLSQTFGLLIANGVLIKIGSAP